MSTLYLHIGIPKTGTTSIQNFLWDNQKVLNARGICYPDPGYRYPGTDFHRNGHFLVRQNPAEGEKLSHFKEGLDEVARLASQYHSIILSDEGLWKDGIRMTRFWPRLAQELKERRLDLRIIVYLRRQDLWAQSFWAQKVKAGKTTLSFPDYLQSLADFSYPMDYCAYMDMLSGLFGKEALIIRIMEKEQLKGEEHSLMSDFLDIFGLSLADGFTEKQDVRNPKFAGTYLELKRTLNLLPWFQDTKELSFSGPIMKVQEQNPFHYDLRGSFFAPGEQERFYNSFVESNSRLAREYLGREDGVLFLDNRFEPPAAPISEKELLYDTILVYGTILQKLKDQNTRQQKLIRELQKETAALSRGRRGGAGKDAAEGNLKKLRRYLKNRL